MKVVHCLGLCAVSFACATTAAAHAEIAILNLRNSYPSLAKSQRHNIILPQSLRRKLRQSRKASRPVQVLYELYIYIFIYIYIVHVSKMLLKSSQSNIAGSLWVSKCGKGKRTHVYIMYPIFLRMRDFTWYKFVAEEFLWAPLRIRLIIRDGDLNLLSAAPEWRKNKNTPQKLQTSTRDQYSSPLHHTRCLGLDLNPSLLKQVALCTWSFAAGWEG